MTKKKPLWHTSSSATQVHVTCWYTNLVEVEAVPSMMKAVPLDLGLVKRRPLASSIRFLRSLYWNLGKEGGGDGRVGMR